MKFNEWIYHEGTTYKCPVEEGTLLKVRCNDGKEWYTTGQDYCLWNHQSLYHLTAYKVIASASGKWIPWNGGECPVQRYTKVDYLRRCNDRFDGIEAGYLGWRHTPGGSDIVAYRLSDISSSKSTKKDPWIKWDGGAWEFNGTIVYQRRDSHYLMYIDGMTQL